MQQELQPSHLLCSLTCFILFVHLYDLQRKYLSLVVQALYDNEEEGAAVHINQTRRGQWVTLTRIRDGWQDC